MVTGNELVTFDMIKYMQSGYKNLDFGWELGTVDASGNEATATTVMRSAFLPADLLCGVTLNIDSEDPLPSGERVNDWFYNEDKSFIGRGNAYTTTAKISIPSEAAYVRFVAAAATPDKVSAVVLARKCDVELNKAIDDVRQGVEDAERDLAGVQRDIDAICDGYKNLDFGWKYGTVDQNGGDTPASTVKRSAYIPVGLLRGVTLVIDSQEELSSPERVNSWLYYADKSPYRRGTSYTVSSAIGNIPDDAAFVRFIAAEQTVPKVSMTVLARSYDLSLKSQIESIETVELNWEPGSIDNSGAEISDASRLRSGFISRDALAGSTMYIDDSIAPNRVNGYLYDKNKKFILRYGTYSETGAVVNPTTNPPWRYARFVCMATDRNLIRVGCDNSSRLANTEETVTQLLAAIPDQSVSSLNSDREHLLYSASQSCAPRLRGGSVDDPPGTALGFIHFSDVHGTLISWKRLGAYLNQHTNLFSFALHTGDYVPSDQGNYNESVNNLYRLVQTDKPVLNCLGNHDVLLSDGVTKNPDPSAARSLLFADIDNWGVNQPSDDVMYYYRDFDDVRLIVLDQYYADSAEHTWLTNLLDDARISGKAVITASHTQTAPITHTIGTFNDIDRPSANLIETNGFESAIKSFRDDGGTHICHLGGHWHWDVVGTTDNGILNILVECATIYGGGHRNDIRRTGVNKPEGASRAYDCFNAVFVDTFTHTIRIIRIGSNTDNYLHPKNTMCIDYTTGNLISNT